MNTGSCFKEIPWETRNLGPHSFELTAEFIKNPDGARLKEGIAVEVEAHKEIFIQARIGKENLKTCAVLEKNGFYFVEAAITPYTVFKRNPVLKVFIDDKSGFIPEKINVNDLNLSRLDRADENRRDLIKEIAQESFWEDRFHLDQNCAGKVADKRFVMWVEEMLADEGVVFNLLEYHGKAAAFMARRSGELLLAGFAKQYVISGLADFFWLSVLEEMYSQNLSKTETIISVNNTSIMNLYSRIGFSYKNPMATFHFWSRFHGK